MSHSFRLRRMEWRMRLKLTSVLFILDVMLPSGCPPVGLPRSSPKAGRSRVCRKKRHGQLNYDYGTTTHLPLLVICNHFLWNADSKVSKGLDTTSTRLYYVPRLCKKVSLLGFGHLCEGSRHGSSAAEFKSVCQVGKFI